MQREHIQPLAHTGLRRESTAGAPQGSQTHPLTLGAGGSALSVSQSVPVHDLRMASQNVTGFQQPRTQHYAGSPQNAHAGPSRHPNPGQNVQNVARGHYRNVQPAPGPVRSNSTPHTQFAPYPQPQFNNGYAQVITGHGHYPAPPTNHAQNLAHDGRRASMSSLNAGPSQISQAHPMQISFGAQPSCAQNVPGPSSMPQAPEPPRPHQQPHGPERNPPPMTPLQQSASASAPAPAPAHPQHPQHPQTPRASGPPQPHNALPTPPATSAGPSNANAPSAASADPMALMLHAANQKARSILLPMRDTVADSLSAVHVAFTQELAKAHAMFVKSETKAVEAQVRLAALREELAQARAERDRALERCEQLTKERGVALEEIRKMNENLPKLVVEHYQLKGDHAALRREVEELRETNAQLREKAALSLDAALQFNTRAVPPSLLQQQHPSDVSGVKLEFPGATSGGADSAPAPVAQVKDELVTMKEANSPTDIDDEAAFELVRDFKVRKQKHRDQADPQHERPRSISGQRPPPPPSEAAAAPSLMRVNSPSLPNVPPTPPAEVSPWSRKIILNTATTAQTPPTPTPGAAQSSDAGGSTREREPKLEEEADAPQSALHLHSHSSIPELGQLDFSGVLDIIDLTRDFEMTDSPPNFAAADLPPLPESGSPSEERKRAVEPDWNGRQETPNKRQRTGDGVGGSAAQDGVVEHGNGNLQEINVNETFLRSVIEAAAQEASRAEEDQTLPAPVPTPAAPTVPYSHEDGQDTKPFFSSGLNDSNGQGDQLPKRDRAVPSALQPVTNGVPIPPMGLSTPPSPSPTDIHPPVPRPARRSESRPQETPKLLTPALVSSASVAPAVSSPSSPTGVVQSPSISARPSPVLSTPVPSPLPANTSPSSSAPPPPSSSRLPPPSPPKQPTISRTAKPFPLSLSVATLSSSQKPPKPPSASPSVPSPQAPPVTPVANALAGINLSLPSPTNAVHLPTEIPPPSPPKSEPPQKKLGINHIDLIYRRVGSGYYLCRFCERRHKEVPNCPSTKFAANAPGHILIGHVEKEHPTSVQKMSEMTPEDIREARLGLLSADKDDASSVPKKRKSSG